MVELADTLRSGRSGHNARVGSNPSFGTIEQPQGRLPTPWGFFFVTTPPAGAGIPLASAARTIERGNEMAKRSRRFRPTLAQWLTFGIACVALYFIIVLAGKSHAFQIVLAEKRELQRQVLQVQERRDELQRLVEQTRSAGYLDQLAREELGWASAAEGSVLLQYQGTPAATPTPAVPSTPPPAGPPFWHLWRKRFLGP